MTTNSDASFARTLKERLGREFPDLAFSCNGGRVGPGRVRVMRLLIEGRPPFQFPFPPLGTHTEEVNLALLRVARQHIQFVNKRNSSA